MVSSAKVLSVGLGDLVSSRNASLRTVGFEVVAATSFVEVVQQCSAIRFDVSIVGHAFSLLEHTEFVRCLQGIFHLPVILITEGPALNSLRADLHVQVDAPLQDLIWAIGQLSGEKPYQRAAS
jgi:hypothetical protein